MSTKKLLEEEIQSEIEEISKMEVGSDKHKAATEALAKLMDKYNEMDKLELEYQDKYDNREEDRRLKEKQLQHDKKDALAKSHNINVVRVDCNYIDIENRYDYIKEHILISELSQVLDLSKINFSLCRIVAEKSIFISVCDLVNQGMQSFVEIAEKLEISNTTVSRYLKTACESGYLDIDYNDLKQQSLDIGYQKNKQRNENRPNGFNRTPVKCIETGEIFNSMNAADKKYGGCVSSYLSGRIKYTGHLDDGTVLHWERI